MTKRLNFYNANKENWGDLQVAVSELLRECLASKKDFVVEFRENKTPKQLRGYWRLIDLITPYLQDKFGGCFDRDLASEFVKIRTGYVEKVEAKKQVLQVPKSLKNATKQDLNHLIETIYRICNYFDIKDYELTTQEIKEIENE